MAVPFPDRFNAGRLLAQRLGKYAHRRDVLVLGLPRGGVPVAFEVAQALGAPLDVFVVRKLGVPGHEELAMGALASGGLRVLNQDIIDHLGISQDLIARAASEEQAELTRREKLYRGHRAAPVVRDHVVILIDDGLATGATMRAAAGAIRQEKPARLIIAVPVAAADTCEELRQHADEVICLETPEPFHAVGVWFEDFSQTTDQEVRELLARASHGISAGPRA